MTKIPTKKEEFITFEGVDLVRAREATGLYQKDLASKCSLGLGKLRRCEEGQWVVIPHGYQVIEKESFELIQKALF